ncbi:hypothetical protein QJQ45_000464 [Haematococcus lacustris]|nr:hypothetical protein QJQ45_000464 [Haematococcus lacustris]
MTRKQQRSADEPDDGPLAGADDAPARKQGPAMKKDAQRWMLEALCKEHPTKGWDMGRVTIPTAVGMLTELCEDYDAQRGLGKDMSATTLKELHLALNTMYTSQRINEQDPNALCNLMKNISYDTAYKNLAFRIKRANRRQEGVESQQCEVTLTAFTQSVAYLRQLPDLSAAFMRYVYERLTPAGRKPGFVQLLATQMVSAIWHGLYPGYMLFFAGSFSPALLVMPPAGSALWIHFSTVVWKLEQRYLPRALATSLPWVALKLLWTHYTLNYMASAFMVLEARGSLAVYQGVYYWPHVVMLVGNLVVGPLLLGGGKAKGKDKGKGQGSVTKTE